MSRLRHGDYTEHLKGKTIDRVTWTNDATENFRCLSVFFTDETMATFRFHLSLEEEAELQDFIAGDISNERALVPTPIVRKKVEPLEGQ